MTTVLRIAAGVAWNRSRQQRWRQVAVLVSAFVFTVGLLAAVSVVEMAASEQERHLARTGVVASIRADTDLLAVQRSDLIDGDRYQVVWIEPATPGLSGTVLPAGVQTMPRPGQAVVSPALDRLLDADPELRKRYPNHLVIGWDGVRSGDELLAYVRPQAGRTLGDATGAIQLRDGEIVGELPMWRLSGFGPSAGHSARFEVGEPSTVPLRMVLGGVAALLVVPGAVVLSVGVGTASAVRERRLEILRAVGVRQRNLRMLAVAETLIVAAPALLAAVVLWAVVGPHLSALPLTSHQMVPGDLALSLPQLLGVLAASAAVATVVAWLQVQPDGAHAGRPRPMTFRRSFSRARFAPLIVAVAAFVMAEVVGGYRAADYALVGVISSIVAVPLIAPVVLGWASAMLARSRSAMASVAGQVLRWDPARAAMPFTGAATLVVLTLAGAGFVASNQLADSDDRPIQATTGAVVGAEWLDVQDGDAARLGDMADAELMVPIHHEHDRQGLTMAASCLEIAVHVPEVSCDPSAAFTLPRDSSGKVAAAMSGSGLGHGPPGEIVLVPQEEFHHASGAVFFDDAPTADLHRRVSNAAMQLVAGPSVRSGSSESLSVSPVLAWVVGGGVAAATGLAVGCMLALVGRLLAAQRHHGPLINLGIRPVQLAGLAACTFAAPFAAVVAVGLAVGVAVALILTASTVPMPWVPVAIVTLVCVAAGVIGTACVAAIQTRSALRERE